MLNLFPVTSDYKVLVPEQYSEKWKPGVYCWSVSAYDYDMYITNFERLEYFKHVFNKPDKNEFEMELYAYGTLEINGDGYFTLPDCVKPYVEKDGVLIFDFSSSLKLMFNITEIVESAANEPSIEEITEAINSLVF